MKYSLCIIAIFFFLQNVLLAQGYLRNDDVTNHLSGITINEVSAFSYPIDYNANGVVEGGDKDEFIEIVNSSDIALNINGWTLASGREDDMDLFVFPDTSILPGKSLVFFCRNSDISNFDPGSGNMVFAGTSNLFRLANNNPDAVGLRNTNDLYISVHWNKAGVVNSGFLTGSPTLVGEDVEIDSVWIAGQSQSRNPEYTGIWSQHPTISGTVNWSQNNPTRTIFEPKASPGRYYDEFPVNSAPQIISAAITSTLEDVLYEYQVVAIDPDVGDVLTYNLSVAPSWLSINSSSGLISGTPVNANVGDTTVAVVVADLSGSADSQIYTLAVNNTNDRPEITSTAVTQATEDVLYEYQVVATDPDVGDVLTYSFSIAPSWLSINSSSGLISGTPVNANVGDTTVTVLVDDGNGTEATDSQTYTLTVNNVNDPPVITGQLPLSTPEETTLEVTIANVTIDDPDNTYPEDFTLSVQDGDNYTHDGNTITPIADFNGDLTVPVTVNDGESDSGVFNLTVTVTDENDPPLITGQSPLSTAEETALEITIVNVTIDDPDNTYPEDFTLSVQDGSNYTHANNTITPAVDFNGDLTVPVIVNDGEDDSESFDLTVSVTAENDVPVITAHSVLNIPEETPLEITLANLTVTDPDNTYPDDFTLSVQDGDNYTRSGNTITPVANFNGALTVPVTVNDGVATSEAFNVNVSVSSENDVPVITAQATLTTPEETALEITLTDLTVTDPDNTYPDDFTLTVRDGENYTRTDNTITPVTDFNGDLTVAVSVNDGLADSEDFDLTVSVTAINDVPVIADQVALNTAEETALEITLTTLTVTDPDNTYPDDFTLSAQDGENYTRLDNSITPIENFVGNLSVPVTVNDGSADSEVFNLVVSVDGVNDPPVISDLPEMTFKEDSSLAFTVAELLGYVDDPESSDEELLIVPVVGENVTIALEGDTLVVFGAPENWNGFDTLSVIVSDGELSDTASVFVEVTPLNDAPFFTDMLPDTVEIYLMADEDMNLEEFADDADFDMPKDSLRWQVSVSDDTLKFDFDPETKDLTLTAPEYMDVFTVTITVTDDSGAVAEGMFYVNVTVDPTAIEDNLEYGIPTEYVLKQNYPNPFNPTTNIKFGMPQASDVVLEVYNLLGQKIVTLFEGYKAAGYHVVDFDASNLPTGMYFYRIQSEKFQSVKKMMLVK